jgi:hypothetical protein
MLKYVCLFSLLVSCTDMKNKAFYEAQIKDIREDLVLRDQVLDTLMFSAYIDDNAVINVPFAINKGKVLVIKTSNFDCDECLDMVMHEMEAGQWAKQMPAELWYEGELKNSGVGYRDWYGKAKGEMQFREISSELNGLNSNNRQKPFLFIYDAGSKEITHIYFPVTGKVQSVGEYLQIVKAKYFTSAKNTNVTGVTHDKN